MKDHFYQLMLLEHLWTGPMRAQMKALTKLETCLGDDHDLVLLLERFNARRAIPGCRKPLSEEAARNRHFTRT